GRVGEQTRRLDDDVDAEFLPWQLRGVFLAQELDGVAVDADGVAFGLDRGAERAERSVVLEQMRERLGVADVVDRDDLEVRLQFPGGPVDVAADASKAVDANLECHRGELLVRVKRVERVGLNVRRSGVRAFGTPR